jgi:hypothetical protein
MVAFSLLPLSLGVYIAVKSPSQFFGLTQHGLESSLRFASGILFCIALPTAAVLFMLSRRTSVWVFFACLTWFAVKTAAEDRFSDNLGNIFLLLIAAMFVYSLFFRWLGRLH